MLAQWADIIFRKLIAFINVTAYFAHKAFFTLCLRFWLYILLIVGVGHGILVAHNTGFCDTADKHSMCAKIHVLLHLQRHKGIDVFIQEYQSIVRTVNLLTSEFICAASTLETELLEDGKWSIHRQAVDIENTGLADHMMGVICLIDVDRNAVW